MISELNGLRIGLIITAAGSGRRMKSHIRKQFLDLQGFPVLYWTLKAFREFDWLSPVVLTIPADSKKFVENEILEKCRFNQGIELAAGGNKRQNSVYAAIQMLGERCDFVIIHDGVRPFVRKEHIQAVIQAAVEHGAAVLGYPSIDTVKLSAGQFIEKTTDRKKIWLVQTPQVFKFSIIQSACEAARRDNFNATDDAALIERLGHNVYLVQGHPYNIKITTPEDLEVAGKLLPLFFKR